MAVTTLDPKTALLVIDLQQGIVNIPSAHPVDGVLANASALAETFRKHDRPVVLVNVTGGAPGRTEAPAGGAANCPRTGPTWCPNSTSARTTTRCPSRPGVRSPEPAWTST